jgi:hypothetical protein
MPGRRDVDVRKANAEDSRKKMALLDGGGPGSPHEEVNRLIS